MNPHFIKTTNVNKNSDNTKETESQSLMSDSVTKSYNTFFGDEHLPKGHITTHPFSLTLEELSGLLKNGQENYHNFEVLQAKPHKDSRVSTDYSVEKFSTKPVGESGENNKSTSVGPLSNDPTDCEKAQPLETLAKKDSRVSTDYSVEKFSTKPVGESGENNKSTSVDPLSDSPTDCEKAQPLETLAKKDSRVSTDYSVEKFSTKPVGGSGWLHKYTKLTETKTGLVEYPRVKEGQRSADNPKHWYWDVRFVG